MNRPEPEWHIVVLTKGCSKFLQDCLQSVHSARTKFAGSVAVTCFQDGPPVPVLSSTIAACRDITNFKLMTSDVCTGISTARNSAISATPSRFVLCLDGDDKISPEYLTTSTKTFSPGVDIVFTWRQRIEATGEPIEGLFEPRQATLHDLLRGNIIHAACPFRRNLWKRINGYDETMMHWEDYEFWIRCLKASAVIKPTTPTACLLHRIHPASTSQRYMNSNPNLQQLRHEIAIRHKEWSSWKCNYLSF